MMEYFPVSRLCTQGEMESDDFRQWMERLQENPTRRHRKMWEYYFVIKSLQEQGMLEPGRRGLVFAVGQEPLPALFASFGCEIVATDMDESRAKRAGWVHTNQHAANLKVLNERGICPPQEFAERVSYRTVDMNHIPRDLTGFDFTWSCCSFEHLGSIRRGQRFIWNMMNCMRPGGIGVHTTEYNLSSNWHTVTRGGTVIFRRRDVDKIASKLTQDGHQIVVDYNRGDMPLDKYIDMPPYSDDKHLRLRLGHYDTTSVGLVIRKCPLAARQAA